MKTKMTLNGSIEVILETNSSSFSGLLQRKSLLQQNQERSGGSRGLEYRYFFE